MKLQRAASGIALVAVAGCRSPTQITVELTTDVDCATAQTNGTTIQTGSASDLAQSTTSTANTSACANGTIGSVVLVPSGAKNDAVAIRVVTGVLANAETCTAPLYTGCIVARRSLRYIPHTPLRLPIPMEMACLGQPCAEDETCVGGDCKSAVIGDVDDCANGAGCGEASLLPLADGGSPDSGIDVDGSADGSPCVAGLVASAQGEVMGLTLARSRLYWTTTTSQLGTAPIGLNQTSRLLGQALRLPASRPVALPIVVGSASLYWLDSAQAIHQTDLASSIDTIYHPNGTARALGIDATNLYYWAQTVPGLTQETLSPPHATIELSSRSTIREIAVNDTAVYTTDAMAVTSSTKGKSSNLTEIDTQGTPQAIAVDNAGVYWTDLADVDFAEPALQTRIVFAAGEGAVKLALDAANVYWTTNAQSPPGAALRRKPRAGGAAQTLVPSLVKPTFVVVGTRCIYYEDSGAIYQSPL